MKKPLFQRGLLAMVVATLSAAAFAQAPPYTETGDSGSFSDSVWTTDRYAPNGWTPGATDPLGGSALKVHIDNADRRNLRTGGFNSSFYDTQGRVRINGFKATEVGAELYIPSSWGVQGNLRQAAIWARDTSPIEGQAYYPIISFINNDPIDPYNPVAVPEPRFRVWDSREDAGGWITVTAPIHWNNYNKIVIKDTGHSHEYYINDVKVYELTGEGYSLPGNEGFKQIILNHTNFGNETNTVSLPDSSYDVYWRNVYASDVPVAVDDTITVDANSSFAVGPAVLANDISPNGRPLSLYDVSTPDHGSFTFVGGQLNYQVGDYEGPATFSYVVVDNQGQSATATVTLNVQKPVPASLTLEATSLRGGLSTSGTVTLDKPVTTGSCVVTLQSLNPTIVTVPATVSITAGDTAAFPVTTKQVLSKQQVIIRATANGTTVKKTIILNPIKIQSLKLGAGSAYGGAEDGILTVKLAAAPTEHPITVNISGDNDAVADLDGVTSVTFGIGEDTKQIPVDTHVVLTGTSVKFTASRGDLDDPADDKEINLFVRPVPVATLSVDTSKLSPGQSGTALVTLAYTLLPGESAVVQISSPGNLLTIPATLTITGSSSGTFTYTAPAVSLGYTAIVTLKAVRVATAKTPITIKRN